MSRAFVHNYLDRIGNHMDLSARAERFSADRVGYGRYEHGITAERSAHHSRLADRSYGLAIYVFNRICYNCTGVGGRHDQLGSNGPALAYGVFLICKSDRLRERLYGYSAFGRLAVVAAGSDDCGAGGFRRNCAVFVDFRHIGVAAGPCGDEHLLFPHCPERHRSADIQSAACRVQRYRLGRVEHRYVIVCFYAVGSRRGHP